jgi:transcriptional regulator with XRE-family HTH domain
LSGENQLNTFGGWLKTMRNRTIRGDHTMTQDEFAAELKQYYSKSSSEDNKPLSKAAVSTWESGAKNPPLGDKDFIDAVARIFDVTGADVLKAAGYNLGPAYEAELDEQRKRLLAAYDSGDLERLVRVALSRLDEQGEAQAHRLGMDGDEDTGPADVTRAARR